MFETNSEKAFAGLIILVAFLLLYLLMTMPVPTAEGYCTMDCSQGTKDIDYQSGGDISLNDICPSSCDCCEIYKVEQNVVMDGWTIYYKCCNCVGSSELGLPECQGAFGWLYNALGRCRFAVEE